MTGIRLKLRWVGVLLLAGGFLTAMTGPRTSIQQLVMTLNEVPAGQEILSQALTHWHAKSLAELLPHIQWAAVSRTDTILTRKLNPLTGQEEQVREVTIFLKEDQGLEQRLGNLSHELVHAVSLPSFDPYDVQLTVGQYIQAAISGRGGEVAAVSRECQVVLEWKFQGGSQVERCSAYLPEPGKELVGLNTEKMEQDFYRVGDWYTQVRQALGKESARLPLLSQAAPVFYSSVGHAPYPAALIREFQALNQAACQNSKKRLREMNEQLASQATATALSEAYSGAEAAFGQPASTSPTFVVPTRKERLAPPPPLIKQEQKNAQTQTRAFLASRCQENLEASDVGK